MDDGTFLGALHALGLDKFVPIILALHMVASALDASLPQPDPGSHWIPLRKALSFLALAVGNAANASQPPMITWLQRIVILLAQHVPEPTAREVTAQIQSQGIPVIVIGDTKPPPP